MKTFTQILKSLNNEQKKAVLSPAGSFLILAGSGTGKTKTLIYKVAYLIQNQKVDPENILVIVLSQRAAFMIKEELKKLLPQGKKMPLVGTFSYFCIKILKQHIHLLGFSNNFSIIDELDQEVLIKRIIKYSNINLDDFSLSYIRSEIQHLKGKLITPQIFEKEIKFSSQKILLKIYKQYQQELKRRNALDLLDLLTFTITLFQKFHNIAKIYQERFKYIIIDDYQDTLPLHCQLLKILSKNHKNIWACGDEHQGIYSFRGASLKNILNFKKDFPQAKIIYLSQNYRSTGNIVEASNCFISKEKTNLTKNMWTLKEKGDKIIVQEVPREKEEGEVIVQEILNITWGKNLDILFKPVSNFDKKDLFLQKSKEKLSTNILERVKQVDGNRKTKEKLSLREKLEEEIGQKISFQDFAVFYRNPAQSRLIEEVMIKYNLPYKVIGGEKFYERKEIKDVIAYLKFLTNPQDWLSLERIINLPRRRLGSKAQKIIEEYLTKGRKWKDIVNSKKSFNKDQFKALNRFGQLISKLSFKIKNLKPSEIINLVIKETGYIKLLQSNKEKDKLENITELKTLAQKFDNLRGFLGINALLEEISFFVPSDEIDPNASCVNLMTLPWAKGSEFPYVFMVGMEEGIFPSPEALSDPDKLAEERRLCYMGMTRAKKRLYLIYARKRKLFGAIIERTPSRFIKEIPERLLIRL